MATDDIGYTYRWNLWINWPGVNPTIKPGISSTKERIFPKEKINTIQKVLKKASAWSEAKEVGKAFIPSGNASQAFDRIQIKFKEKGY